MQYIWEVVLAAEKNGSETDPGNHETTMRWQRCEAHIWRYPFTI